MNNFGEKPFNHLSIKKESTAPIQTPLIGSIVPTAVVMTNLTVLKGKDSIRGFIPNESL